jgi:tetratricopeptide (TPR) repeat protein
LRRALALAPYRSEVHDFLIKAHLIAGEMAAAAEAAEQFAGCMAHPKTILRAASIWAQLGHYERAQSILTRGIELFPASPALRQAKAEVDCLGGRKQAALGK